MISIENEKLKVSVKLKGAELCSIVDKNTRTEYIWQGNPDIWSYHAPNLFPIVGNVKNNILNVDGSQYPLNRHGFARTSIFRRIESSPNHAVFSLAFDEETLKIYPYKFEFEVVYHLTETTLTIFYKVINKDDRKIYFSVGAHPAFNVPLEQGEVYEDYYIKFAEPEELVSSLLSPDGLFNGQHAPILTKNGKLALNHNLFANDALVFKDLKSKSVSLKNKKGTKEIKLDFPQFKELGIWAKSGASFVCIEPWLGYADSELGHQDISEKAGIQSVEHGHVFEVSYSITIKAES